MSITNKIEITRAESRYRPSIVSLLQKENLPVEDLPEILPHFLIAMDNNQVIGVIGLEQYENIGLLRSMAVDKLYRNRSIASELVMELENLAIKKGIHCIYLLTETASDFFKKRKYEVITRNEAPGSVKASSEFSSVCPVSAIVMRKLL